MLAGPMELDELRRRVRRGEVNAADLVWQEEFVDWLPLAQAPVACAALEEPRLRPRTLPPPLRLPEPSGPPVAAIPTACPGPIASTGQLAWTPAAAPLQANLAAPVAPRAELRSFARWPVLAAVLAGAVLLLAATLLFIVRSRTQSFPPAAPALAPRALAPRALAPRALAPRASVLHVSGPRDAGSPSPALMPESRPAPPCDLGGMVLRER